MVPLTQKKKNKKKTATAEVQPRTASQKFLSRNLIATHAINSSRCKTPIRRAAAQPIAVFFAQPPAPGSQLRGEPMPGPGRGRCRRCCYWPAWARPFGGPCRRTRAAARPAAAAQMTAWRAGRRVASRGGAAGRAGAHGRPVHTGFHSHPRSLRRQITSSTSHVRRTDGPSLQYVIM